MITLNLLLFNFFLGISFKNIIKMISKQEFVVFLVSLWVTLGLLGFIWSIICFGSSGTITEKFMGLIVSSLFGPLYWVYLYSTGYCTFFCDKSSIKLN